MYLSEKIKKKIVLLSIILSLSWIFFIFLKNNNSSQVTLNVYNWGEFMSLGGSGSLNVNEKFTEKTGIKINYTTFQSNEEMLAKIMGGGADYDVIFPSEYVTEKLIKNDMLEKIDLNNIPNYKFLYHELKNLSFDPKNEYSLPYFWGVLGIFYNKKFVKEKITWDLLWNKKYSKRILMCDNVRDAASIALLRKGKDVNSTNPSDWKVAFNDLNSQRPLVQSYICDQIFDKLLAEEAYIAPFYYGHSSQGNMLDGNNDIKFAVPPEGTNKFIDCVCILKGSKHKREAEEYINFLYENDISYANSKVVGNFSPNKNIYENCFKEGSEYLKSYDMSKAHLYEDLPSDISKMNDELWIKVKVGENNSGNKNDNFYVLILILIFISLILIYTVMLLRKIRKNRGVSK